MFALANACSAGTSLQCYPEFDLREDEAERIFGKPNSDWSYIESDRGFTGHWVFEETGTAEIVTLYFRWGTARIGGRNPEAARRFSEYLNMTATYADLSEKVVF